MNFLSRLIVLLIISISFSAPAGAVVAMDLDSYCGAINADDDKFEAQLECFNESRTLIDSIRLFDDGINGD